MRSYAVFNISQHDFTPEQVEDINNIHEGYEKKIISLPNVKQILTVESLPNRSGLRDRAGQLIEEMDKVVEEGPYYRGYLIHFAGLPVIGALLHERRPGQIFSSFSVRDKVEEVVDGKTISRSVFKHGGFYFW